jgi:HAD superfamily hydrolase (TIGR01459 family)
MQHNYSEIKDLSNLIDQYDAYIFDIWGVLHDGGEVFEGTLEIFNYLAEKKEVRVMSNAPRRRETIASALQESGFNIEKKDIFTSGETARIILKNPSKYIGISNPKLFHMGHERNTELTEDIDIDFTNKFEEANLILLSAFKDAEENYQEIIDLMQYAAKNNIPVLCSNPDRKVMHLGKPRNCAGYFADYCINSGGKVIYSGKPDILIYNECLNSLNTKYQDRILMIGDTFHTDIDGAHNSGIHSALVLNGNMGVSMKKLDMQNEIDAANFICDSLKQKPNHLIRVK